MFPSHGVGDPPDVGNRPRRVTDVLVETFTRWRFHPQATAFPQVELFGFRVCRRPCRELMPLIGSRLKDVRLRQFGVWGIFEEMLEKRVLDLLAIKHGGLRGEVDISQRSAVRARPPA